MYLNNNNFILIYYILTKRCKTDFAIFGIFGIFVHVMFGDTVLYTGYSVCQYITIIYYIYGLTWSFHDTGRLEVQIDYTIVIN